MAGSLLRVQENFTVRYQDTLGEILWLKHRFFLLSSVP